MAASLSPSPEPQQIDHDDAQRRLAQLEALLAQEFDLAPPVSLSTPSENADDRPAKRKKTTHDNEGYTAHSDAEPGAADGDKEVVAFRLFSTQKAPQTVVLREAKSPEPFVADRRIRAVEDEPEDVVAARRAAIGLLTVDGFSLLASSSLPPPTSFRHPAPTPRRALLPPQLCPSHPLPNLAYLDVALPPSLYKLSPAAVPDEEDPPEHPNDGLLSRGPFDRSVKKKEDEKGGKKTKDPRPRIPPRRKVEAWETHHGVRVKLKVVPILKVEKPGLGGGKQGAVSLKQEGVAVKSKQGGRVSKSRRERMRKRLGAVAAQPVVAGAAPVVAA
ncbi:hypothetical protein JCM8547_007871 [Rhodosporidiobolus lusitaniae]